MKINVGDYFIETDERQFIVKVKKVVEESRLAKKENIGKEYWQPIAYCTTFDSALKFVPQQALRSNDDINVVIDKLTQIERDIKAITNDMINSQERLEDLNRYIELNYESEGV